MQYPALEGVLLCRFHNTIITSQAGTHGGSDVACPDEPSNTGLLCTLGLVPLQSHAGRLDANADLSPASM